jgi:hypothetical protein
MITDESYVCAILSELEEKGYMKFWDAHINYGFPLVYREGKDLQWALEYLSWIEDPKTGELIFLKKKD